MSDPNSKPHRAAPLDLWAIARTLLVEFCQIFGEPQAIAASEAVTAKNRKLMLSWLRACEAALRHLLLIEAAALPSNNPPSS